MGLIATKKILIGLSLLLSGFSSTGQINAEETLSFIDPLDQRNTFSEYVGRHLTLDKQSKTTITLIVFKINSKNQISDIRHWGDLEKSVESEVIGAIQKSAAHWKFSNTSLNEKWVILPLFIGSPYQKSSSLGMELFLSLEKQFALLRGQLGSNLTNVYLSFPRNASSLFQVVQIIE
jgi:hypothetical protein